jgi:hypothetical protein
VAADRYIANVKEGRTAAGQPEQAFEGDGLIEIAAYLEAAIAEGLQPGELTPAQPHPGVRVGLDRDIRTPARGSLADEGSALSAPDLPDSSQIAQANVVGRVEARIGAEISLRERTERLIYQR